jgi:glycosyltransferase involved in cell wall biosynthesis
MKKIKVLFDARFVQYSKMDGITRFSLALIRELLKFSEIELFFLVSTTKQLKIIPDQKYILTNRPSDLSEFFQSFRLNRYGFDVLFSPYYFLGGFFKKYVLIQTIHDFIPFDYRCLRTKSQWWIFRSIKRRLFHSTRWFLKRILKNSDAVVTVSETVKNQIAQITDRPITVISCSSEQQNIKNQCLTRNLLFIGRFDPHKNIETLIRAMDWLDGYSLLLAGNCSEIRKKELMKYSIAKERIQFLGTIDDAHYMRLLANCFAYVMPSKAEGFGLPIVEAMNAGCPVICSNIPIFHEVAGNWALFFEVNDAVDLARQVKTLEDPKLRQTLIENANVHVQRYSWEKSAKKLLNLIYAVKENCSHSHR